jgi:hypothetical protein
LVREVADHTSAQRRIAWIDSRMVTAIGTISFSAVGRSAVVGPGQRLLSRIGLFGHQIEDRAEVANIKGA